MAGPVPRPGILEISPYVGGRATAPEAPRRSPIKLSSNESPRGPSPRAVEAYNAQAGSLHRYPDGGATALRAKLAEIHGIDAGRIVCGNGSDELIALLARAYAGPGDEVLHTQYGFLVYPIAARSAGATPVAAPEPAFRADVDALLDRASERTKVVFLANPNNPTGSYLTSQEMRRLHAGLPDGTLLVIDSAYAEYVGAEGYDEGIGMVEDHDNVVMTRTFSKIYGLASLRLGWAYCPPAVADVLNRIRGPFNVTGPALAAGVAALEDAAHVEAARRHNDRWLPWLEAELTRLGIGVEPSVANFVLARFPDTRRRNAEAAAAFLAERAILPRTMHEYGLPGYLRITIGLEDELRILVSALDEFMS